MDKSFGLHPGYWHVMIKVSYSPTPATHHGESGGRGGQQDVGTDSAFVCSVDRSSKEESKIRIGRRIR